MRSRPARRRNLSILASWHPLSNSVLLAVMTNLGADLPVNQIRSCLSVGRSLCLSVLSLWSGTALPADRAGRVSPSCLCDGPSLTPC